jgi:nucleotide-binding universal stress UspA family protein
MYRSILVPVDLDEPSSWSKALPTAISLARNDSARLTIGTVIPTFRAATEAQWFAAAWRELVEEARCRLRDLAIAHELQDAELRIDEGSIYRGILRLAEQAGADLIVLASHRPAMKDYLLGANAAHVVRHAPCSVLVVRE